ncbi:immunoglobulin superfamily member 8 isoform X1 [Perca flavescens]|uniref:immunoglobulin superfamily member 8 isoform X1 n=2 Tax=Perca flavescens TaxID=8167 RepID=UPI00106EC546|nr:immunoglobulin superfamily member 8-like isoform X1 [Perca flavescens]
MKMDSCLFTLVFGLSVLGGCLARVVTVSPGPLIRVAGQTVSIRCDVTEYGGPNEQDFEWTMTKEANGKKMNIISSFDARFSDPSLSKRVASGDISVARLKDNEVELKIAEVKSTDAGFYWCQTPSTDAVISGNYEAKVQLTVILNTLKVSPLTPPPVVPEGSDLTLSCNVTRELSHPTYLSVTWSVKRGATSEEILTFGPQGDVVTGAKYTRRYADGGIRLVPGKNGFFQLVISKVTTSDEGTYECNGTEWTYESGGKWIKIVESTKEMGTVAVTPTGQSLSVKAWSSSPSSTPLLLSPGEKLTLVCSVSADNLPALALEVTWLADGRELVTMELSGVVISNTSSGGAQGKRGEATLERTGVGEYRLGVRGVSGDDGGVYTCRIRAFIEKGGRSSGGGGRWHMAAEKTSSPVTVKVAQINSQDGCDYNAIKGKDFTVPLSSKLEQYHQLKWRHNNTVIVDRRKANVFVVGNNKDVSKDGSLLLKNLKDSDNGIYTAELFTSEGTKTGELKSIKLCIFDHVLKPKVTKVCSLPFVTFTCQVTAKDLKFAWLQNKNVLEKEKTQTLKRKAEEVENDFFQCKVSNPVSSETSDSVTQEPCYKHKSILPEKLFGISTWVCMGVKGGVVLVLIIVVIVCCVCTKQKKPMQLKDEGELRLLWTNEQQHHQHQHNHPTDPHHHRSSPTSLQTAPRAAAAAAAASPSSGPARSLP